MFDRILYQLRLSWRLIRDPRVPVTAKLIPLAALVYVLSPLDLIPDIFVLFGQLDDLGILLLSLRGLEMAAPASVVAEHKAALEGKADGNTIEARDYSITHREDQRG